MIHGPISEEISIALAAFFFGGAGPSHHALTLVAAGAGYGDDDPYSPATQAPNKQVRVQTVLLATTRRPQRARELIDGLLVRLRVHGCFDPERETYDGQHARMTYQALLDQLLGADTDVLRRVLEHAMQRLIEAEAAGRRRVDQPLYAPMRGSWRIAHVYEDPLRSPRSGGLVMPFRPAASSN